MPFVVQWSVDELLQNQALTGSVSANFDYLVDSTLIEFYIAVFQYNGFFIDIVLLAEPMHHVASV